MKAELYIFHLAKNSHQFSNNAIFEDIINTRVRLFKVLEDRTPPPLKKSINYSGGLNRGGGGSSPQAPGASAFFEYYEVIITVGV